MRDPASELRRIPLPKLSEKGYKQRSDRGFGQYTEGEMSRKASSLAFGEATLQARRGFSDSFSTH
jgi:hypothetical protein